MPAGPIRRAPRWRHAPEDVGSFAMESEASDRRIGSSARWVLRQLHVEAGATLGQGNHRGCELHKKTSSLHARPRAPKMVGVKQGWDARHPPSLASRMPISRRLAVHRDAIARKIARSSPGLWLRFHGPNTFERARFSVQAIDSMSEIPRLSVRRHPAASLSDEALPRPRCRLPLTSTRDALAGAPPGGAPRVGVALPHPALSAVRVALEKISSRRDMKPR